MRSRVNRSSSLAAGAHGGGSGGGGAGRASRGEGDAVAWAGEEAEVELRAGAEGPPRREGLPLLGLYWGGAGRGACALLLRGAAAGSRVLMKKTRGESEQQAKSGAAARLPAEREGYVSAEADPGVKQRPGALDGHGRGREGAQDDVWRPGGLRREAEAEAGRRADVPRVQEIRGACCEEGSNI